eukprot:2682700-Pyramimonas_sp.AAC.1
MMCALTDQMERLKKLRLRSVDVKGYSVDVKGYSVTLDVKGYGVDVKGHDADVKGYCVDIKGCSFRRLPQVLTEKDATVGSILTHTVRQLENA